ncbi:hypothetical protein B1H32_22215 [Xanthomonas vasicola pv. vasculorum]|nr:hypothetical protein B1H32_22215 [Xanthomonas vasicola pv. vasculorum]
MACGAGTAAELEAAGVRVRALRDLLDLPAVVIGTLGVTDAGACSGEGAAAPISCLSWTANWHKSIIAWRWSVSACARSSIVGHR